MKQITKTQLEGIANDYGMNFDLDSENPSIYRFHKGKPYGFEATEVDEENISGFRFFGETKFQSSLLEVWNELTEVKTSDELLTIELAKSLIGKKIIAAYRTSSGYENEMNIEVIDVVERNEKAIGQSTTHHLIFIEDGNQKDYVYEWQGIFRVTGSAHNVFLKKVE